MVERPKKNPTSDANDTNDSDDVDMKDTDASSVEVPMMHLASFALHKLFSEWQNDGFEIPDLKTTNQQDKVVGFSELITNRILDIDFIRRAMVSLTYSFYIRLHRKYRPTKLNYQQTMKRCILPCFFQW